MSRTGENIYKRKDGRWEARYHYHSDCHRRIRCSLTLLPGILARSIIRGLGVPDKVAHHQN